jgi:hypothetical protein
MPPFRTIPPEEIARLKVLYEDTGVPVRDLARLAGFGVTTFLRRVDLWKWKRRRRHAIEYDAAVAAGLDLRPVAAFVEPLMDKVDKARVIAEVRSAAAAIAARINATLTATEGVMLRAPDAERAARTLNSVLQVLEDAERVEGQGNDDEFRDLDAFCADLTRRLEAIRRGDPA